MFNITGGVYVDRRASAAPRSAMIVLHRVSGIARTATAIVALMALASLPMLLRFWVFFPSLHDG